MKRVKMTVLALMVLVAAAGCQAGIKGSSDVVSVVPGSSSVTAQAGQRVDFTIKLDIARTWHIYAHADTNFIGVDLVPAKTFPLQDFEATYPEGHQKEFFGEKVFMIEGKDVIKGSAMIPETMAPGEYPLEFKVTVQACDDKTCLAPAYIPVTVNLKVQ